jgi:hypothetical protein
MPLTRPNPTKLRTDLPAPAHEEGVIFYDNVNKALSVYNEEPDITLQVGQEQWVRVYNGSGGLISNGQVCYMSGTNGEFPVVGLAMADAAGTADTVLGLATHDIEDGTFGYLTTHGTVHDVDTSSFSNGDRLYLSATVAGGLVTVAPESPPNYRIEIGSAVFIHATSGTIYVNIDINPLLSDVPTTAGNVSLLSVGNATFDNVQQMQDIYHSAGWANGGDITDAGSGQVNVTTGSGFIRAVDSLIDTLFALDWSETLGISLTDNSENFIYVEYNGGSPQVVATTIERTDFQTNILLGRVYRTGTDIHINQSVRYVVANHASAMIQRLQAVAAYQHESGAVISETGTRNIAISSGAFWEGLVRFTTNTFDSSAADTFTNVYKDGVGGFVLTSGQTQINNQNFDDGTGTLAVVGNNNYGVHWIYISTDSHIYSVFGTAEYSTVVDAEASTAPSSANLPGVINSHGRIIGRIIIQKSAASFAAINSAFINGKLLSGTTQNLWATIVGDSGSTLANIVNDVLTVAGGTNLTTVISGDTLTINQDEIINLTASTTDDTPTEMTSGGSFLTLATDTTVAFSILVVARRTDVDGESAAYKIEGCIDNNAGTTALVGSAPTTVIAEDTAAWDVVATANDAGDRLTLTVTGEVGKTISWRAKVMYAQVTG